MAAVIQVKSRMHDCLFISCMLCLFCVINVNSLELEIPCNSGPGYYVTKLGCSKTELNIDIPSTTQTPFDELFQITKSGDLIVQKSLSEQGTKYFVLSVTRTNSECPINLPLSKRTINIEIKDCRTVLPSFSNSLYRVVLSQIGRTRSSSTIITTKELKENRFHGEKFELIGDSKEMFQLVFTRNGLEISINPKTSTLKQEYHFTIVAKNKEEKVICSTHLKVLINGRRQVKLTDDVTEARKRLVAMTIRARENALEIKQKLDQQQLAVSFNQDNFADPGSVKLEDSFRSKRHEVLSRRKRQTTTDLSTTIKENKEEPLYTITPGGTAGTRFVIESSNPSGFLKVTDAGEINLETGKKLDYDAGMRKITVNVNEVTTDGKVAHQHRLTINIEDANDEVPVFTNQPLELLAKAEATAPVGTSVFQLTAFDPDTDSRIVYNLEGSSSLFEVVNTTGVVQTKAKLTQTTTETIRVSASDINASPVQTSAVKSLEITTLDRAPQFYLSHYYASVPENNNVDQTFPFLNVDNAEVELKAVNFQKGSTTTFTILNPNTQQPSQLFEVVKVDGKFKVQVKQTFDHEKRTEYNLKLQGKDMYSKLFTDVDLTVRIADENEFAPVFIPTTYVVSNFLESSAVGTPVVTVTASDEDTSTTMTYTLMDMDSSNSNIGNFSIDSKGVISVKTKLDYDDTPDKMYQFRVVATDDKGVKNVQRSATATVIVNMKNVNDQTPQFVKNNWVQTVRDDADKPNGQRQVLKVQAVDYDGDGVSYQFQGSAPGNGLFEIDSTSGLISLANGKIIPPNINTYNFKVLAVDNGGCCPGGAGTPHTATTSVTINIVDALNTKPKFPPDCNGKKVNVKELQGANVNVGSPVTAEDDSRGEYGTVDYSIRADQGFPALTYFKINSQSGQVSTTRNLDRDDLNLRNKEIYITVKAKDRGSPPLSDLCTFQVILQDINNHKPRFGSASFVHVILKKTAVNTHIFTVRATDMDAGSNAAITYSFDPATHEYFTINGQTGAISLKQSVNSASAPTTFTLTVMAKDGGSPSLNTTASLTINVLDSSTETAPSWPQQQYSYTVSETVPKGHTIATLTATAGGDRVAIENMATDLDDMFKFKSPSENTVEIVLKELLDYEKKTQYNILLRASNQQTNPLNAYATVIINVEDKNDESPKFVGIPKSSVNNFIELSVLENENAGVLVGYVVALDRDINAVFKSVNYTVKPATPNVGNFTIEADTGAIKTTGTFDAEAVGSTGTYFVTILAQDGAISDFPNSEGPNTGPNTDSKGVKVTISDVNDKTPQFTKSEFTFSVKEDASLLSVVGQVDATDEDAGHTFYYSLDSTPAGQAIPFSVGWTDGNIIVTNFLDYEKQPSYNLRVTVFDGKFSNTAPVTITIEDFNDQIPKFGSSVYRYEKTVSEGVDYAANPVILDTLTAMDGDTGRTAQTQFRFSIRSSDQDILNNFELDSTTGVLKVKGTLDRDRPGKESYRFTVAVVDEPSAPQLTGYATVIVIPLDKNDNAPVFDPETLKGSILENSPVDTKVLDVKATDKDQGINAALTYSIKSGSQAPQAHFKIRTSNEIGVVETSVNNIDREDTKQYTMIIHVEDGAAGAEKKSAEATATILVLDRNDNPPKFNVSKFDISIKETFIGDILELHAYDLDDSSILTYSVRPQDFTHFNVEKRGTAFLQVHNSPDFDIGQVQFDVIVTVTDGDQSDTCTINITVLDVNDNAPNFTSVTVMQNGAFLETAAVGTKVAEFAAEDIDSGLNKEFDFFILLESDPKKYFEVVATGKGQTGEVKIRKSLDREDIETFSLVLLAIDKGSPPMTGSTTVKITVEDINDSDPVLSADSRVLQVTEGEAKRVLGILTADDPDTKKYGPPFRFDIPTCSNAKPSVCNLFSFDKPSRLSDDSERLRVSSLVVFDREDVSEYLVPIVIKDTKGEVNSRTGTSTLTIEVLDINDNDNEDAKQSVSVYNYMGLFNNVNIGLVGFNDKDGDDRSTKRFTKVGHKYTDKYFEVATESGIIKMLDKVPFGAHTFEVQVVDDKIVDSSKSTGFRTKTSTTTLSVFIEELAEEAPYMSGSTRLCGTTAEKFVAPSSSGVSAYDKWRNRLSNALNYPTPDNVQMINVLNKKIDGKDCIDVRYAAHGSPYFPPSVMDGIVAENKADFQNDAGAEIVMVNIDECLSESTCEAGCYNELVVKDEPSIVNANTATVVGVATELKAICGCRTPVNQSECTPDYCLNEGECVKDLWGVLSCKCTSGFDGPRCQRIIQGFNGDGQGLFKPLEQCKNWVTSIEFLTANQNGLIMYQGPDKTLKDEDPTDFLALQLRSGYPELKINLGTGVLTLTIDGKDSAGVLKLGKLNDEKWHHIDIVKEGKLITVTVDYCTVAVSPDGGGTPDRKACEASGYTPSTHMYLNVNTPLQLGGRYVQPTSPVDIIATKFTGCMRNLRHKGEIYDLHTAGTQTGVLDKCQAKETACANKNCGNGKCHLVQAGTNPEAICVCDVQYRGDNCQFKTSIRQFAANSFIDWSLASVFYTDKKTEFQLEYRSRDDGLIFHLSSTAAAEFITLQIRNSELELLYNIGDGQKTLLMEGVPASDGQWHTVYVKHLGLTWILSMDGGEGPRYITSRGGENGHEEITLNQKQLYAGAELSYASGSGKIVGNDFKDSCINDIRLDSKWFPMSTSESSSNQYVKYVSQQNTQITECKRDGCVGVDCPYGQECINLWGAHLCRCKGGYELTTQSGILKCTKIDYCKDSPCFVGATCVSHASNFSCVCPSDWTGFLCNRQKQVEPEPEDENDNTGMIVGIIIGVLLAIVLAIVLFVIIYTQCRRSDELDNLVYDDKDDYEIRENIVAYDEEGAGEEDQEGYDLNRLRKPMDTMTRMDKPIYNTENERLGKSALPNGPGVGDFINDRLQDADDDPNAPPHDTVQDFNHEGGGSDAGSLSSLNTSSSGGDQDYDYLNEWGPKFARLADMYNQYDDSE